MTPILHSAALFVMMKICIYPLTLEKEEGMSPRREQAFLICLKLYPSVFPKCLQPKPPCSRGSCFLWVFFCFPSFVWSCFVWIVSCLWKNVNDWTQEGSPKDQTAPGRDVRMESVTFLWRRQKLLSTLDASQSLQASSEELKIIFNVQSLIYLVILQFVCERLLTQTSHWAFKF